MSDGNIIRIDSTNMLSECLDVLNASYTERDERLGIAREYKNAVLSYDYVKEMYEKRAPMYGYFAGGRMVGFLALKIGEDAVKIKDIVVLPDYQKSGIGGELLDFAKEFAKSEKKERIVLGFLYAITALKDWYEKRGFKLVEVAEYPTAKVGYMEFVL